MISERAWLFVDVIPQVMRTIRGHMRASTAGRLTVPQFRILNRLRRSPLSNQELAQWMGVSAPTMSKMVDKLVKRGFLRRKTHHKDRRITTVSCTQKGLKLSQDIRTQVHTCIVEQLARIPEHKLAQLEAGLNVMKEIFL